MNGLRPWSVIQECDVMTISVLAPLQVSVAGRPIALPAKQRTLLAILAFQANRTVPQDRLIEASWGEDASSGIAKTLHSHVFQLRRALSQAGDLGACEPRIVTDLGGYRLQADPSAIDANVFMALVEAARAAGSGSRTTVAHLRQAVALWRGPGVADVGDEPGAMAEIHQLEWHRLGAIEDLARLRLALGEHEQLIPELRRAVAETPYNEQLWASLMIALGRCGKRAEALMAFQHARDALRAELDIEPGSELRDIARRLRAGMSLDLGRGGTTRNRNHRRVRTLVRDARH
jgi:DNA-binding SARP family transcriptional activator